MPRSPYVYVGRGPSSSDRQLPNARMGSFSRQLTCVPSFSKLFYYTGCFALLLENLDVDFPARGSLGIIRHQITSELVMATVSYIFSSIGKWAISGRCWSLQGP